MTLFIASALWIFIYLSLLVLLWLHSGHTFINVASLWRSSTSFIFHFFLHSRDLFSIYFYIVTTLNKGFYFPMFIYYFNRYIMFSRPLTVFYLEFPAIFWHTFPVHLDWLILHLVFWFMPTFSWGFYIDCLDW